MTRLYHHTCEHSAQLIDERGGLLLPHPQPVLGGMPLLWLTTLARPARAQLGLTSHMLSCDRMAVTYQLPADAAEVYSWAWLRPTMPRAGVIRLEAARGTRPALWWVSLIEQHAERVR